MCKLVVQSKWAMYYLLVSLNPRTDFRAFGGIDSWHLSNINKYCFYCLLIVIVRHHVQD